MISDFPNDLFALAKWTIEKSDIFRNPQNHQSASNSIKIPKTRKLRKFKKLKKMSYPLSRLPPYWWPIPSILEEMIHMTG